MNKRMYVYMMMNEGNTVIYTGVTNNLVRRVWEHKNGVGSKFVSRYRLRKLVYFEEFEFPIDAIEREKQIKAGSRKKKEELILGMNPKFLDLYGSILK